MTIRYNVKAEHIFKCKNKNNGISVLIHPRNIEKQYHLNLLLEFLLKYEVNFTALVCFN